MEAVEGDTRRTDCVVRGGLCRASERCCVHDAFTAAQEAMIGHLQSVALGDVCGEAPARQVVG